MDETSPRTRRSGALPRFGALAVGPVSGALVVVGAAGLALRYGVAPSELLVYAAYVLGCLLVPGYVVQRTLLGPQRSWWSDAVIALGTGVVLTLPAWMLVGILGIRAWLWVWPAAALIVMTSRRARARIFARPTATWHPWAKVTVAAAMLIGLAHLARTFLAVWQLPPTARAYYPDLLWHLGLVSEAMRAFPLGVPQAATTGLLRYQWFADADIAGAAMVTGIPAPTVLLRLWPILMVVLAIGLTAVVADVVARRSGVAALSAALVTAAYLITPWGSQLDYNDLFRPISPSQLYAFTPMLIAAVALVQLLRSTRVPTGPGVLAVLALVVCAGAKPTVLAIIAGGAVVAVVATLVRRQDWRRYAAIAAGAAVIAAGGLALVAGGDAGVAVKIFHVVTLAPFARATGDPAALELPGLIMPGLLAGAASLAAVPMAGLVLGARLLFGLAPVLNPTLRRDDVAWFLAGMSGAGLAAALTLGHPGYSELYFLFTAVPFAAVLGAWWLCTVADSSRRRRLAALACGAGILLAAGFARIDAALAGLDADQYRRSLAVGATVLVVVLAVPAGVAFRRRRRDGRTPMAVGLVGLLVGVVIASLVPTVVRSGAPPPSSARNLAQSAAADWIAGHTPASALFATNNHCIGPEQSTCNSRVWWLSGLGGRRVLLEGWSYTPESSALAPTSPLRPVFDLPLWQFNQALFTSPTAHSIARARDAGVDYLVATAGATAVSPRLSTLCDVVYRNGIVTIYRLPRV